jgi:hypothetical protein
MLFCNVAYFLDEKKKYEFSKPDSYVFLKIKGERYISQYTVYSLDY